MLRLLFRYFKEETEKYRRLKADILVYQMAKVGSFGIYNSLKKSGASVSHIHLLSNKASFCIGHSSFERALLAIRGALSLTWIRAMIYLRRREYRIITIVRAPVDRNISLMFQMFAGLLPQVLREVGGASKETNEQELLYRMFTRINPAYPEQWFESELQKVFDVDVFAHEFDRERGFCIIRKPGVSVLVLRTEDLLQHEVTIRDFTENPQFSLQSENRANRKWYASMHKRFVDTFTLSQPVLNQLYSSRYMKHFYTDHQIRKLKQKWST